MIFRLGIFMEWLEAALSEEKTLPESSLLCRAASGVAEVEPSHLEMLQALSKLHKYISRPGYAQALNKAKTFLHRYLSVYKTRDGQATGAGKVIVDHEARGYLKEFVAQSGSSKSIHNPILLAVEAANLVTKNVSSDRLAVHSFQWDLFKTSNSILEARDRSVVNFGGAWRDFSKGPGGKALSPEELATALPVQLVSKMFAKAFTSTTDIAMSNSSFRDITQERGPRRGKGASLGFEGILF